MPKTTQCFRLQIKIVGDCHLDKYSGASDKSTIISYKTERLLQFNPAFHKNISRSLFGCSQLPETRSRATLRFLRPLTPPSPRLLYPRRWADTFAAGGASSRCQERVAPTVLPGPAHHRNTSSDGEKRFDLLDLPSLLLYETIQDQASERLPTCPSTGRKE